MSSTPHTLEPLPVITKDFDFVFATDTRPRNYSSSVQRQMTVAPSAPVRDDALAFHEEFKTLVLAEPPTPHEEDTYAPIFVDLFDPHELDWDDFLVEEAAPVRASSLPLTPVLPTPALPQARPTVPRARQTVVATTVVAKPAIPTAPQQIVKPLTGPRPGTPKPIETWVVKVIAVLVGLNLLFAGLIVAGVRVNDLFR